ncbi:uncharacterized protein LOC119302102 [Triticum dicoccoides]|uniref:Uncharacterized protein n=1 Tax=Triticum turgidum subsp. durum TaxID=4567 RepID=A0A9R0WQK2_TRITD|nr:uncharacterized protein LOC119302102 [Triticum dicoccoides]VAI19176.1 unnamed protein product [Triticum turgidum subsp. durum]
MDVDAAPALKRKGADAPELWLDDDVGPGFPVAPRATKIRRLDPDMMPIVPGAVVPPPPPGTQPPVAGFGVAEEAPMCGDAAVVPVDMATAPPLPANEERAIVLYRPAEAERRLLLGPLRPGGHLRVSPQWIQALNGTVLQEASNRRALFEGLAGAEASNLAMVTWAPSRAQAASTAAEMMEAEDGESASMEVEQDRSGQQLPMPLWPQQQPHCMVQQQPIPVAWSL